MNEDKPVVEDVKAGEIVVEEGGDYVPVEEGEPYKAHIGKVGKTERIKYGTVDQKETALVIGFELDEGPGKGQVYSGWYTLSLHEKSALGALCAAVFGEIPKSLDVTSLEGMPLRITLYTKPSNGRQYPKTYLKAAADQKKVEVKDQVLTPEEADQINGDDPVAQASDVFGQVEEIS